MKRWLKYSLFTLVFLLIAFFVFDFFYGIDVQGTLSTRYTESDSTGKKFVNTSIFVMEVPDTWIHVFAGFGNEGGAVGNFITRKGIIHYECGLFAPGCNLDSTWIFKERVDTINHYIVRTGINENEDEYCISILGSEAYEQLTFYMSGAVKKNYVALMEGVEKLKIRNWYPRNPQLKPWNSLEDN